MCIISTKNRKSFEADAQPSAGPAQKQRGPVSSLTLDGERKMGFLFSTPFPLVFAFLIFLGLSTPKISSKQWARLGRGLCICFFGVFLFISFQLMNEKGNIGQRKSDAHDVTVFTAEVSRLIAQGKQQNAKELLDKFNDKYPAISGHVEAKKFLDELTQAAKKN